MSSTKNSLSHLAVAVVALVAMGSAHAQVNPQVTIDDLAAMQRAKLKDAMLKSQGGPVVNVDGPKPVVLTPKPPPPPPPTARLAVHAIVTSGRGVTVAELTDGRNIIQAVPGRTYGPFVVNAVTPAGVTVAEVKCSKKCAPERLVTVGGSF
jgi:hypothetical protein